MRAPALVAAAVAALSLGSASAQSQLADVAARLPNPYRMIEHWIVPPAGRTLGSVSAVEPARDGSLWIAERCGANDCLANPDVAPVLHVAGDGRWLGAFGAGLFAWPHGLHVDPEGNVWVTDARGGNGLGHRVLKFSPSGELLLTLGEAGVAGSGPTRFNGPTDVVVAPDGSVFVTDGHEPDSNNRVVKFSSRGEYVTEWGGTGSAPGQFLVPHAIALDSRGRVLVADRDNNRIQIFDQDGRWLDEWRQFGRPSGLHVGPGDVLYVSDNQSNDERHPGWRRGIRIGSALDGSLTAFIPDPEFDPARAEETGAHGLAANDDGTIFGAEVYGLTVKKYLLR